jgi:hypothetical protein
MDNERPAPPFSLEGSLPGVGLPIFSFAQGPLPKRLMTGERIGPRHPGCGSNDDWPCEPPTLQSAARAPVRGPGYLTTTAMSPTRPR